MYKGNKKKTKVMKIGVNLVLQMDASGPHPQNDVFEKDISIK